MKRLASILLLFILLFNFIGYRFVTSYLEERADNRLEARLDQNEYDDAQLISIKTPITHLAYYNNSNQFERVDGKVEINGIQYKYVKRRFFKDSAEMLCIPNPTAMRLQSAKDEFFKLVNDLEHTGQGKKNTPHSPTKNFSLDNFTLSKQINLENCFVELKSDRTLDYSSDLVSCFSPTAEQPPDTIA